MGIAMFSASSLFSPMHVLMGWLMPRARPAACVRGANRPAIHVAEHGQAVTGARRTVAVHEPTSPAARRPLRVLRVVESNEAPAHAGRMLISGRMADVCAELDRLAANEAAQHCA
jgi:hypothetical protein